MRVIGGKAKGLRLKSLSTQRVRPTGDRVKEAIFNQIRPGIYGSRFLDLFAGFGGIGIEALSQGAKEVYFIENDPRILNILKENLKKTSLQDGAHLIKGTLPKDLGRVGDLSFSFIFMDPPYHQDLIWPLLFAIHKLSILSCEGILIVEHQSSQVIKELGNPFRLIDKRRYGEEGISLFTRKND